jgi:hypothetical protein
MDMLRNLLLASDFDQTLSFNDSEVVLSELIGFHSFHDKVKGLAEINLVQQGAELSYLVLHDPDFRRVRREHCRRKAIHSHGLLKSRFSTHCVRILPHRNCDAGGRNATGESNQKVSKARSRGLAVPVGG